MPPSGILNFKEKSKNCCKTQHSFVKKHGNKVEEILRKHRLNHIAHFARILNFKDIFDKINLRKDTLGIDIMKRKIKRIMVTILIVIGIIIFLAVSTVFIFRLINSNKYKIDTENGIQESAYIDIKGMKQFIQIHGEDKDNPVMIFIHGGPASPMGYASPYYQKRSFVG